MIHTIAMKTDTAKRHPDLPSKLIKAFREANKLSPGYMSAKEVSGYEKEREVLGEDPYAFVLGQTEKRSIQTLNRYQIEQGLMEKELPLESLFPIEAAAAA